MKRAITVLTLGLFGVSGLLAQAQASLITNGNFDASVPSNGTGGGWTTATIDFAGGWRPTGGNTGGMFILNSNGAPATDPTISQLVTGLVPGETYRLTGEYANVYSAQSSFGGEGPNTFAVDIDNVNLDKLDFPGFPAWGAFSFDIVAPDTDIFISFRAEIDGDDTDYKIDNISLVQIQAAAVPEPSSLVLMLAGCFMLGAKRCYRRR